MTTDRSLYFDTVMSSDWVRTQTALAITKAIWRWEDAVRAERNNMWISAGKMLDEAHAHVKVIEALVTNTELRDQRGYIERLKSESTDEANQAQKRNQWHVAESYDRQGDVYDKWLTLLPVPETYEEHLAKLAARPHPLD